MSQPAAGPWPAHRDPACPRTGIASCSALSLSAGHMAVGGLSHAENAH